MSDDHETLNKTIITILLGACLVGAGMWGTTAASGTGTSTGSATGASGTGTGADHRGAGWIPSIASPGCDLQAATPVAPGEPLQTAGRWRGDSRTWQVALAEETPTHVRLWCSFGGGDTLYLLAGVGPTLKSRAIAAAKEPLTLRVVPLPVGAAATAPKPGEAQVLWVNVGPTHARYMAQGGELTLRPVGQGVTGTFRMPMLDLARLQTPPQVHLAGAFAAPWE